MATATGLQAMFSKFLAKASQADIKDMLQDAAVSKAFDIVEAGAESLSNAEFVKDEFAMGETGASISEAAVVTGPVEAATGANVERQIAHYSPHLVKQHGTAAAAEDLGRMLSSRMGAMEKSIGNIHQHVSLLSAGVQQLLAKSIAGTAAVTEAVAKSTPEEDRKKEIKKDEEDKDDEKAKSQLLDRASAEFTVAKGKIVAAEEAEGDGLAGTAKSRRTEAGEAFAKAQTLLGAAKAMGAIGDAVEAIAKAMETFGAAKTLVTMQAVYPDSAKTDTTVAKAADQPNAEVLAKAQEIQDALNGIAVLKTDLQGLMATVSGQSRGTGVPPSLTSLAKSDPQGYAREISAKVMSMQDEGILSDSDVIAAQDILGKMQAAHANLIPASAVTSRIAGAPTLVRDLFQAAA